MQSHFTHFRIQYSVCEVKGNGFGQKNHSCHINVFFSVDFGPRKSNRLETGFVYEFCLRLFVNDVNEIKLQLFVIRKFFVAVTFC